MSNFAPLGITAGVTLREAARRRILWMALVAAALLLVVFAVALRLQVLEFQGRPMSPFVRYQVESGMLMVGLYTCDLLAVVMTILTSIDTIAPLKLSMSRSSGIAVISLDFPSTARCPSTRPASVA